MKRTLALTLLALVTVPNSLAAPAPKAPKLVLLISIDQFRADYIDRFSANYLPAKSGGTLGGFRFLSETGARYLDAHHNHVPTATGPGHATLMTGSEPTLDGIAGNDWFDRSTGKTVYCVDDPSAKVVGGGTTNPMSPLNLKVTTVGDELKMATNGRSKVVGVSFKDRAAILMAGHAADAVIWLDSNAGNWVSSSFFCPNGQLPTWVQSLNSSRTIDGYKGQAWEPLLPSSAYALARKAPAEKPATNGKLFSHDLGTSVGKPHYGALTLSGQGQDFLFKSVQKAIEGENLGGHDVPDVLVVNLATNDYVGHRFGPNSPEVMDISIRTDRLLSELFNYLDKRVGIDNVVITLTADHGVLPIVEESKNDYRTGVSRVTESAVSKAVAEALNKAYGDGDWVSSVAAPNLYLNRATIAAKNLKLVDVEKTAAAAASNAPGIYIAFTADQILKGELPNWSWCSLVSNGFNPTLSGDIMVFEGPGDYFGGGTGTGHGSPWAYDSHVPIIMRGPGITPGRYSRNVNTSDIASTLSLLLGIEYPTGNLGKPLEEALKK